jgi:hypothetical protein
MWQKPRVWSQRYAGYEPELHDMGQLRVGPAKRTFTMRALIDSVAQDSRLERAPLPVVKRVTGVRA